MNAELLVTKGLDALQYIKNPYALVGFMFLIGTVAISFFKMPSKAVNFKILNLAEGGRTVEFAFAEVNGTDGKFSIDPKNANFTDVIMFLEPNNKGKLVYTWQLIMNLQPPNGRNPQAGPVNPRPGRGDRGAVIHPAMINDDNTLDPGFDKEQPGDRPKIEPSKADEIARSLVEIMLAVDRIRQLIEKEP